MNSFFQTPDFSLLYSSFFYLYIFGYENTYESVVKYLERFKFFKPKTIGLDLTEEEYNRKYDSYVRGANFKQIMKRIEIDISMRRFEALEEFDFSPRDYIFLLTFYNCYAKKCAIVFQGSPEKFKSVNTEILEQLKQNSSEAVKKLANRSEKIMSSGEKKENEYLVNEIIKTIDQKSLVFKKPSNSSFFAVMDIQRKKDFEKWWNFKCKQMFNINVLNQSDSLLTQKEESKEFTQQLFRHS